MLAFNLGGKCLDQKRTYKQTNIYKPWAVSILRPKLSWREKVLDTQITLMSSQKPTEIRHFCKHLLVLGSFTHHKYKRIKCLF